jgi:5-bromo-4-chloroindolyl phosphate hydrolysis protein
MPHLCEKQVLIDEIKSQVRKALPNLGELTIRELRVIRNELEEARQRRVKE